MAGVGRFIGGLGRLQVALAVADPRTDIWRLQIRGRGPMSRPGERRARRWGRGRARSRLRL